jgi:hypothetical protein
VIHMARRLADVRMKSRAWRAWATTVAAVTTLSYGFASTAVHADEPTPPDMTVPTGEVDGAIVAVDVPPVPPTAVGVAVDVPPVPPTSIAVAVDVPPVPPVTIPDAEPVVAAQAPIPTSSPEVQLPETGPAAARATAIVAAAAMSIGAALKALAQRP